jgi:hypothetical protein
MTKTEFYFKIKRLNQTFFISFDASKPLMHLLPLIPVDSLTPPKEEQNLNQLKQLNSENCRLYFPKQQLNPPNSNNQSNEFTMTLFTGFPKNQAENSANLRLLDLQKSSIEEGLFDGCVLLLSLRLQQQQQQQQSAHTFEQINVPQPYLNEEDDQDD